MPEGPEGTQVCYLVLADDRDPYLLARVRWPDVAQAISEQRPYWQEDPGLFDLPYARSSRRVTKEEAERIAGAWGAGLPEEGKPLTAPAFLRRLPANWDAMAPAELGAWGLDPPATRRRARAGRRAGGRRRATAAAGERHAVGAGQAPGRNGTGSAMSNGAGNGTGNGTSNGTGGEPR